MSKHVVFWYRSENRTSSYIIPHEAELNLKGGLNEGVFGLRHGPCQQNDRQ